MSSELFIMALALAVLLIASSRTALPPAARVEQAPHLPACNALEREQLAPASATPSSYRRVSQARSLGASASTYAPPLLVLRQRSGWQQGGSLSTGWQEGSECAKPTPRSAPSSRPPLGLPPTLHHYEKPQPRSNPMCFCSFLYHHNQQTIAVVSPAKPEAVDQRAGSGRRAARSETRRRMLSPRASANRAAL